MSKPSTIKPLYEIKTYVLLHVIRQQKIMINPYAKKKNSNNNTATGTNNRTSNNIGEASQQQQQQRQQQRNNHELISNQYNRNTTNDATTRIIHNQGSSDNNKSLHFETDLERAASNIIFSNSVVATTFSQAFQSIEETDYYTNQLNAKERATIQSERDVTSNDQHKQQQQQNQQQQQKYNNNNNNNQLTEEDTILAKTLDPDSIENATKNFTTDRDHHVLFQQPHVLYVSTRQKGNGIINYIRNVPITYQTMVPDYVISTTRCVLFLSIKYHNLYPHYIHKRIHSLKTDFTLRILLVLVDVDDNASVLVQLNKLSIQNNLTLILAWSEEEAGRYLETYKVMDGKDAKSIQKREQLYFGDQVSDFLTTKKTGVNKTDSAMLLEQFTTIKNLCSASIDELATIHGMGEIKVRKLYDAFHKPFSTKLLKERKKQKLFEKEKEQQQNQQRKDQKEEADEEEEHEKDENYSYDEIEQEDIQGDDYEKEDEAK